MTSRAGSQPSFGSRIISGGVEIIHVPYKGSAPASTALVSGEIVMGFSEGPVASRP